MANERYVKYGTQYLFADHAGDFGAAPATAANSLIIGTPTDVQIDAGALAASGSARQSAKVDLGSTERGTYCRVDACIELASASGIDGDIIRFFWGGSPNATAGTGNPGGMTGADAAFTVSTNEGNLRQLTPLGQLVCRDNVIAIGYVGVFVPEHRYGSLLIVNDAGQNFATLADEIHVTVTEIVGFS